MKYLPQEVETWYIIPAVRREVSKCLITNFKTSYEKVGKILGISKAAVSQYTKGKRAAKISLPKEVGAKVCTSCKLLVQEKSAAVEEITKIVEFIKAKGLTLSVCGRMNEGVLENCREIKFEGKNYTLVPHHKTLHKEAKKAAGRKFAT